MPIASYSVLKGSPSAGKVVTGASRHYQITINAGTATPFTVAVNIESVDGSEVLYAIEQSFTPPDTAGLETLAAGVTGLSSTAGGLALDYVREQIAGQPMITRAAMTLLPKAVRKATPGAVPGAVPGAADDREMAASRALENAVVALLNAAIAAGDATVYAFGSAYADSGTVDGIHDIHMNQGNPTNNHGDDNGVWQDGALFLEMGGMWTAVFLAFQTESWVTDAMGDPAGAVAM